MPAMADKRAGWADWLILLALSGLLGYLLYHDKDAFWRITDVGHLPELAAVQSQLIPLDLCEIEYAARGKRDIRKNLDRLRVRACSSGGSERVDLIVPDTWGSKEIGYTLSRGARDQRFKIQVEKAEVPLPDLVAALADHVPVILERYEEALASDRTSHAAERSAREAAEARAQAEEAARRARAAGSYAPK